MSETAELPNLDHFSYKDEEFVYQPAQDTYLLCDGILNDKAFLREISPTVVMEVGSGSGCVIVYTCMLLMKLFGEAANDIRAIALDINEMALEMTRKTALANNVRLEAIPSDLFSAVEDEFMGQVDVLIFNPPYVPTESDEIRGTGIEISWAGGVDGREVIDRFLPNISKMLSEKGVLYMILVQENKPDEIADILRRDYNLHSKIIIYRRAVNEGLMVMKVTR